MGLFQFDDPLLTEHGMSLAVVDVPRHVSVSGSLFLSTLPTSPCSLCFRFSLLPYFSTNGVLKTFPIFFVLSLCGSCLFYLSYSTFLSSLSSPHEMVEFSTTKLMIHVFQLHEDGPAAEELDSSCDTSAASHWMLPNCGLRIIRSNKV